MVVFARIIKNSWKSFYRNLWLSLATLGIMVLALTLIGGLILFNASINIFVVALQDKVDVSIYFNQDTAEEDILQVMANLEDREEVKEVRYISRNEALDIFRDRHQDNAILLESLDELDDNPLQASLNIKVYKSEQFEPVVRSLESSASASIIENINFYQNEKIISRISSISSNISRAGIVFTIFMGLFVFLVTFNTMRMAIYTARDEIRVMKLVGASNWFVRGPFIITGAMYGISAALFTLLFLLVGTWFLGSQVSVIFAEINLFGYLVSNLAMASFVLFSAGIMLGTVSSYVAVHRYLNV